MTTPNENIPTPETDAEENRLKWPKFYFDFARSLERRLIQAEQYREETEMAFHLLLTGKEIQAGYDLCEQNTKALSSQPPFTGVWMTKEELERIPCICDNFPVINPRCLRCTLLERFEQKGTK